MFGKFFASTFTGSMMASGPDVFAVWAYVIANTVKSRVELNPQLLAAIIGTDQGRIEGALQVLCDPDPHSRSPEHDGRRLVREGQFQYFVPNHEKYRAIRDEDGRREYNRQKKAEERARKGGNVKPSVNDSQRQSIVSAKAEAEEEAIEHHMPTAPNGAFDIFWAAYPRKTGRKKAETAWKAIKPSAELQAEMLAAVHQQRQSEQWKRQIIPHAATWLNGRRWADEPLEPAQSNPLYGAPGKAVM